MTVSEPRREGQRNKSLFGSSTLIYFSFLETVVSAEKPQPSKVSTDTPTLLPSRGEEGGGGGSGHIQRIEAVKLITCISNKHSTERGKYLDALSSRSVVELFPLVTVSEGRWT